MLFLVKLFPEITIKSRPVRRRLVRLLRKNIKAVLRDFAERIHISGEWDLIEIELDSAADGPLVLEKLQQIPGIASILEVTRHRLPDFAGILQIAKEHYGESLQGKTFAVRCKRTGRHAFRSVDVEAFVGAGLKEQTGNAGVDLQAPQVLVALEIRHEELHVVLARHPGLGGFPLGGQGAVLSLLSGGFDSAVSSYLATRRGLQTHFCFFNLGGEAHRLAVRELALYLWMKYHVSHRVKFVTVPFEGVVREILEVVDNSQMGVVLKRMMLRAAGRIAADLGAEALVTGESVAQVSSQTLTNLAVIDAVTDNLVIRPLAMADKQQIIDLARSIGAEQFSRHIPEYCAVISDKPTTKARKERIEREEARFDFTLLDQAVDKACIELVNEIAFDPGDRAGEIEVLAKPQPGDVVIDIRHPLEQEARPLTRATTFEANSLQIPFYRLREDFPQLGQASRYLLYCERGMMSRLHAAHLRDAGFGKVAVLDPD